MGVTFRGEPPAIEESNRFAHDLNMRLTYVNSSW
jgi:hypothetical protein